MEPKPVSRQAGLILVELASKTADAIAQGDWPAADRLCELTFRLRGDDDYIDVDTWKADR
jgi:hypothetical protein